MKKIFFRAVLIINIILTAVLTSLVCCAQDLQEKDYNTTREEALLSLSIEEKKFPVYVLGKKSEITVAIQTKYNDKYISLKDENTKKILADLGTKISYDEKNITAETLLSTKTINQNILKDGKNEIRLSPPPFFVRGEPFIHIKHLPLIADCHISHCGDTIYMDPVFKDIAVSPQKKHTLITIKCSSGFDYSTLILKNPHRFVIDLQNVHLTKEQLELSKKEIKHDAIGTITYGQNKTQPNMVRIVIPIAENIEVQPLKRDKNNEITLSLTQKTSTPVAVNFPETRVKKVTHSQTKDRLGICVDLSGPAQYESHRFLSPDNRIIVDIHNSILIGKKQTIKVNSQLVEDIRIAQFQLKPTKIVRIVIELKKSYACSLTSPKDKNQLLIGIADKIVKPENNALDQAGATSFPKKNKIICIDPGHGGYDPGAINYSYNCKEKDLTLKIAQKTSQILSQRGWNVVMTRTTDRDVSYYGSTDIEELDARIMVAHNMKADIFVSIHCDASSNPSVRGISTHWYKEIDRRLASCIHSSILKNISSKDRKTQQNRFYVLSKSKIPSVLIETGFITNAQDLDYLSTTKGIELNAKSIADGIENYFKSLKK